MAGMHSCCSFVRFGAAEHSRESATRVSKRIGDPVPVVFALWDLIRYHLPLSRSTLDLLDRLLGQGLHCGAQSHQRLKPDERSKVCTYVGPLAWSGLY